MSVSVKARVPPLPPPKPKVYQLQEPTSRLIQITKDFSNPAVDTIGRRFAIPPGDSDTDSGICADSDSQLSPGRAKTTVQAVLCADQNHNTLPTNFARNCSVGATERQNCNYSPYGDTHLVRQRRLPQRPLLTDNGNSSSRSNRSGKQYRVRFADQVTSSVSSSTSSNLSENEDAGTFSNCSSSYVDRLTAPGRINETPSAEPQRYPFSRGGTREDICAEEAEILPPPPSYSLTMNKIRQHGEQRLSRAQLPVRMMRPHEARSSSLPRAVYNPQRLSDDPWIPAELVKIPMTVEYTVTKANPFHGSLPRSSGDFFLNDSVKPNTIMMRPRTGRMLPEAPINVGGAPRVRQPAYSRQRRARRAQTGHRSHSVGPSWKGFSDPVDNVNLFNFRDNLPAVRAKLIALDHRGFRTVLIEKVKPGPFGFYIATGMINQRRGIFISRVSIPSLIPVLSVGDELLYVENELIKGRSLEYAQSLIAGRKLGSTGHSERTAYPSDFHLREQGANKVPGRQLNLPSETTETAPRSLRKFGIDKLRDKTSETVSTGYSPYTALKQPK